jgi:hypothetical protein
VPELALHVLGAIACIACSAGCGRIAFDPRDEPMPLTTLELTPDRFSTTSPTFEDVPGGTLLVPPSPGQPWLLVVSATLESSSFLFDGPEARYLVDGVERGIGGTEAVVAGAPGPWQHVYAFDGKETPTRIAFQARDSHGATTVIDHLRALAIPLPAISYASSDDLITVTSMEITTVASLSVVPEQPGEHLVLLLVNASEAPGSSDIRVHWLDPETESPWSSTFLVTRGPFQSILLARRAMVSGPTTFALQASTRSVTQSASTRYARVVAIPISAFGGAFDFSYVRASRSTTGAVTLTNELVPAIAPAPAYVVLSTARIDDDCGNAAPATRGAWIQIDELVQTIHHATGNCAYELTYGFVARRETAPAYLATSVSSGNGQLVTHRESSLVVFGAP